MGSGRLEVLQSCCAENSAVCQWDSIRESYSSSLSVMKFLLASSTSTSTSGSETQTGVSHTAVRSFNVFFMEL